MPPFKAFIREFQKIKEIRLNRNIITYLICVIIASILWFLNALNKDYSADLTYPIKYINFPAGQYPVVKLPSQLQLEVKAKGFALLGYRIRTSFLPITFNVSAYNNHLKSKNGVLEYVLNTNDIKDKISTQLSSDIKLLNVYPEEIMFKFAVARHKKVAIRPVVDYTLKRQYILKQITVSPDSILVSGPEPVIDTLSSIQTVPLELKDIGKNINRMVNLVKMPDCTYADEPVEVRVEVEQFTEAKKTIPITPVGVPDSMYIRLFPPTIHISYEIGLSQYDKVSDKDFMFTVNYPVQTASPYLTVKAARIPSSIKNLTYSPQKVEYILEKK